MGRYRSPSLEITKKSRSYIPRLGFVSLRLARDDSRLEHSFITSTLIGRGYLIVWKTPDSTPYKTAVD